MPDLDTTPTVGADESSSDAQSDLSAVSFLNPANLSLPADASAPEFTDQLQALRSQFEDRTSFNFMVCDELARRGIPPNSNSVLKVSKWGSSNSVASDVRAWYASLARRLQASHANIPDAARTRANQLFEQLWTLALSLSVEPFTQRIRETQELAQKTESQRAQLAAVRDRLRGDVDSLGERLSVAQQRCETLELTRENERAAHQAQIATLQSSIAEAALSQSAEVTRLTRELADERQVASDRLGEAQRQAAAATAGYAEGLAKARNEQEILRTRLDNIHKETALQIDAARQDMRDANARAAQSGQVATTLRAEGAALRDKLAEALIAAAQKDARAADLQKQVGQLQAQLTAPKERPAPSRRDGQRRRSTDAG